MSNVLDIDDTLLTKALILPGNKEEHDTDGIMKQFDTRPFVIVQPTPGVCVKCKTDSGEKTFLNICVTDKIPPPEDISVTKLLSLLNEDSPSFVIPMSIGNERLEPDKGGTLCSTYDIAINNTYFKKCQEKSHFMLFTISVTIDGVSNKFGKVLQAENYVILKNRLATGKLQQHRIENREVRKPTVQTEKPLIEEISSNLNQDTVNKKFNTKYVILKEPSKGETKRLIGLFDIPTGTTGEDLSVLLNSDRIVVTADLSTFRYDVTIPYAILVDAVEALLDRDIRVLRLNMPVVPS